MSVKLSKIVDYIVEANILPDRTRESIAVELFINDNRFLLDEKKSFVLIPDSMPHL